MSVSRSVPVIGLVGGVGSGKSSVAKYAAANWVAERLPLLMIDGDAVGHEVLREPETKEQLREVFGESIFQPDGEIDRGAVAKLVFGTEPVHQQHRRKLESVVHPRIRARIKQIIEQAPGQYSAVLLDAAVLLESGWRDVCDAVVFVDTPRERRLQFVQSRSWSEGELDRREASQFPLEQKRRLSDFVIENTGTLEAVGQQLLKILSQLLDCGNPFPV